MLKVHLISIYTLLLNEIKRVIRIWPQSLIPPIIISALYFIIFGKLIGSRIGSMSGVHYIVFISPGLILMSLTTNSYANVVSSFYVARFTRSIEELLVSPMLNITILLGYVLAGVFRGMLIGGLVLGVTIFFTAIEIYSISLTLLVAFIAALLMSTVGFINGMIANSFDDTTIVPTFVLTPLIYLGGIFYSIDLLSPNWQLIAKFNPMLHMVNAFRFAMLGVADLDHIFAIQMLLYSCTAVLVIAYILLSRGYGIRH